MRKHLRLVAILIPMVLVVSNSYAAVKAGSACTKVGAKSVSGGKNYTCIKSGKKLVWDKGVVVAKPSVVKPTPNPSASASSPTIQVGTKCNKQGDSVKSGDINLICRLTSSGNKYFELTNTFTTAGNPKSPDSLTICRLSDQRTKPYQPEGTQIAYPIVPHAGSVKAGIEKIAVVGFDFSDSPGQGSPLEIFGNTMEKSQQFFTWYSNGKVKFEFATHDRWIRLSKPSSSYATGEHFSSIDGALTVNQMAAEFQSAISQHINLSGFTSVWFVYPKTIEKITENFGLASTPAFYGVGPNNYSIELPIWTYFVHEMLHEQGLQGHSPKEPWRFGVLLNGNGYTAGLNSWDELAVDWMTEDEIYCIDKANLKPVQIELAPIERQQSGVHTIIVKLDGHRALVIESHRGGDFAPGMPDYGYGVTIQLVDTTKSTPWDGTEATSEYLKISNEQRYGPEYGTRIDVKRANDSGVNLYNGIGVSGARWGLDQNFLLLEGEKKTFEGITISFVKSGNTDSISISK